MWDMAGLYQDTGISINGPLVDSRVASAEGEFGIQGQAEKCAVELGNHAAVCHDGHRAFPVVFPQQL